MYHDPRNGSQKKVCIGRIPTYVLEKVPLRQPEDLGNAWGIELVEGRKWEMFWYIFAVVFFCSTAFGLVYGVIHKDMSAGFTIAGFLQTSLGVGVGLATLSATVDYLS